MPQRLREKYLTHKATYRGAEGHYHLHGLTLTTHIKVSVVNVALLVKCLYFLGRGC